ncbi:MAG: diadenylate cyclase CdaA [Endomicrobiales bacterium]|nr:diadenylate cyclase CdaA [Endomicrobiales bacterium]
MHLFLNLWSNFFVHVIDILLIAYILYRLLLLIKGTMAVQMILGILTIIIVTVIAQVVLDLKTLSWLLEKFWIAAVVVVVVVFQPEIRSALAHLGSHRWGRVFLPSGNFIDEVIDAVITASEQKIGMLIVFEKELGLRNFADTGTHLNADVSKELILSIFNTRSPLHDGALILVNGRVMAAACLLPLSEDHYIAKTYGTRHRAAIGITESTDAIVIVVSEETGKISIVNDAKMVQTDCEELKVRFLELYIKTPSAI